MGGDRAELGGFAGSLRRRRRSALSACIWASVQVASPSAAEGLTVTPSGSATTVFSGSVSAIAPGQSRPWFGSAQLEVKARGVLGQPRGRLGGDRRVRRGPLRSRSSAPGARRRRAPGRSASAKTPGASLESALTVVTRAAPSQEAGRVRKGGSRARQEGSSLRRVRGRSGRVRRRGRGRPGRPRSSRCTACTSAAGWGVDPRRRSLSSLLQRGVLQRVEAERR